MLLSTTPISVPTRILAVVNQLWYITFPVLRSTPIDGSPVQSQVIG